MSSTDINRLEHTALPQSYTSNGQDTMAQATAMKQGLLAIAYAISDLAEAVRYPSWAPDPESESDKNEVPF